MSNNTIFQYQLNQIALLVRELRTNDNLTQEELAEVLSIHRNTISRIENGKSFSLATLLQISDFFNVRLSELFADISKN